MKLEVTKWIVDFSVNVFKQVSEFLLRCLLFLLPLGVYLFLMEFRNKVSSISNITVYTEDNSVWQHVFPGFILVNVKPGLFRAGITNKYMNFQKWVERNKYVISLVFALLFVGLMLLHK